MSQVPEMTTARERSSVVLRCAAGSYEIVVARLDELDVTEALPVLSEEERQRADRFVVERGRERYICGRAHLRRLLADRLGRPPQAIAIRTTAHGKPELAMPDDVSGLRFNVSHSGDVAIYGFTMGRAIGVDVEAMATPVDRDAIVRRFFSPAEQSAYLDLDAAERPLGFVHCWTRKEAFIKALGQGLSCPLDAFDVSLAPGAEAWLLRVDSAVGETGNWQVASFTPCPGHVAAVVVDVRGDVARQGLAA